MSRQHDIDTLRRAGFEVEPDEDAGVLRLSGPGLDVTLPLEGEQGRAALAQYADPEWISAHKEAIRPPTAAQIAELTAEQERQRAEEAEAAVTLEERVRALEAKV